MTTAAQADAHREHITALSTVDGPLTTTSPHASVNNRAWFVRSGGRLQARPGRDDLHTRLLFEFGTRNVEVRQDRRAIVLAGPPGAGKSTALRGLMAGTGTRLEQWRVINPDDFKDDLLEQALSE